MSHNTGFLPAASQWLTTSLLSRILASPAMPSIADESTDIRTRNEMSLCIRFLEDGKAVELFTGPRQVKPTTALDVRDEILKMLKHWKFQLDRTN